MEYTRADKSFGKEEEMDEGPAFLKEGKDLSGRINVRRAPPPRIDPQTDDFIFMQIDTDYYNAIPPSKQFNFQLKMNF